MKGTKTLVKNAKLTDRQLKDFFLEVVNTADRLVDGSDDYLAQKYRRFFPTRDRDVQLMARLFWQSRDANDPFLLKEMGEILCRAVIGELRDRLRAVWLAGYEEVAEWRLFILQLHIHRVTNAEDQKKRYLHPPSPDTLLELAIDWVRRNIWMLRVCRNPECPRPFFVARVAQERICSDACIAIVQKAHKRRWWTEKKASHLHKRENRQRPVVQEAADPSMETDRANAATTAGTRTYPELETRPGAKILRSQSRIQGGESERTLKRFLQNVVNAPENRVAHLISAYAKFFPAMSRTEQLVARKAFHDPFLTPEDLRTVRERERREELEQLQKGLESIWNADNHYTARWRLFTLQSELQGRTHLFRSEELNPPPTDQPIHQALAFLRKNLHLLRTCSNASCQTFRFFIASKPGQKYCSTSCTTAVQKEFKTRWWKEKGSQWRKSRRAKQKTSRKAGRQRL